MLLHASRAAGRLTKLALLGAVGALGGSIARKAIGAAGSIAGKVGGAAWHNPGKALGVGVTTAVVAPMAAQGLRQAKVGLTPEYAQYSQNRGVSALPNL